MVTISLSDPMSLLWMITATHAAPIGAGWVAADMDIDWDRIAGVSTTEERRWRDGRPEIRVILSAAGREALAQRGVALRDPIADHRLGALVAGYHDARAASAALGAAVARSGRAGMARIGVSREGIGIDAAWFGVPPGQGAPVVRILSGHHGDEPIAVEVALAIADQLSDRDGLDATVTDLLDRSTVWIVPAVNPDGLAQGARFNAADVDLNRNYDYAWDGQTSRAGDTPFSEPETQAIRTHALLERPFISLSLHAGATNLGWPWNFTNSPPPDTPQMEQIAERYLGSCTTPDFWITQGADWYITHGDTNDWAYGRYGTLDYTLEVSADKYPPPEQISEIVEQHKTSILEFISTTPSLSGRVTDAETGQPIEAMLSLDVPSPPFFTDPLTGSFYRILPIAGDGAPRQVAASARGYTTGWVDIEDGRADISLFRSTRARPQYPSLVISPDHEVGSIHIAANTELVLSQPGASDLALAPGDILDPSEIYPGFWTVQTLEGAVWANLILVEDPRGGRIDRWSDDGWIEGTGFSVGTRVFGAWGDRRELTELTVRGETSDSVRFDPSPIPMDEDVALAIFTGGAVLGIKDLHAIDSSADEPRLGCACATPTGHFLGAVRSVGGWGMTLAPILTFTRRRRS